MFGFFSGLLFPAAVIKSNSEMERCFCLVLAILLSPCQLLTVTGEAFKSVGKCWGIGWHVKIIWGASVRARVRVGSLQTPGFTERTLLSLCRGEREAEAICGQLG